MSNIKLNTIEEAIEDIRDGKLLIVVDDEDRENEGDFICSAEKITPELVNFMATHGRGLICAALPEERCEELELDLMVGIQIITIRDLIKFKLERDSIIEKGERVNLPTDSGDFEFIPFRQISNGLEHSALVRGTWTKEDPVLVRVHSSCFTGDIFGSLRCDCGPQLHEAMEMVEKEGKGEVIYLSQEG